MTETQNPTRPYGPKTDLSDLMALFGRFASSVILMMLTILMLVKHNYAVAAVAALVATLTQRATINLHRRLRNERAAALAAMQSATTEGPSHAS